MRYPSEMLEALVPTVGGAEDAVLDRIFAIRNWLVGFKVWHWSDQARRIDELETKNRVLVQALKKIRDEYRQETGKPPPESLALVLADDDMQKRVFGHLYAAAARIVDVYCGRAS